MTFDKLYFLNMKYKKLLKLTSLMLLLAVAGESGLHLLFHSLSRDIYGTPVQSSEFFYSTESSCPIQPQVNIFDSCPFCALLHAGLVPEHSIPEIRAAGPALLIPGADTHASIPLLNIKHSRAPPSLS